MDGSKQPAQAQVPHGDANLKSTNETQDEGSSGSSSVVEGGTTGTEEANKPPAQEQVPHGDANLKSVNETQETGNAGSTSAVSGGEVGDDKSEKSAAIGLFGTADMKDVLNRLKAM